MNRPMWKLSCLPNVSKLAKLIDYIESLANLSFRFFEDASRPKSFSIDNCNLVMSENRKIRIIIMQRISNLY